jgi:thiamine kinase-like enzyme
MEALPNGVSNESLTRWLRASGALGDGRVGDIAVESARSTLLSKVLRLRIAYEGEAAGAPASVFFKTGLPERLNTGWGRSETAFYAKVAPETPAGLLPRCFEAHFDDDRKDWRLLLEDLTDTHAIVTVWPLPPTSADCKRIIEARARFHASWWDDPRLGASIGQWDEASAIDAFLRRLAERLAQFADRLGDGLPRERRELYDAVLDRAPKLIARYGRQRNMTIVHGDAHVWNCFLPRDGGADVRLFDWDSWRLGSATEDLSYMMAVHWYPDRRRRMEAPLLDAYHAALGEYGVKTYDRSALAEDYRLSVLWQIMTPVLQAGIAIPPVIWWNNYERIFMAVEDLGCRELLG